MVHYVTRIAPSPTGDMHIGTARTAYFNWLAARASGGHFILRIDDTDPERSKPEYTQVILDTMAWLGLDYDQIEYQSRRLARYENFATSLLECRLAQRLDDGAVVLDIGGFDMPKSFHDSIAGDVPITNTDIGMMIPGFTKDKNGDTQKSNGVVLLRSPDSKGVQHPTFNFACVVDDIDMGVNYIIRGVDHLTNTARHVAIYAAIGRMHGCDPRVPKYAHLGLIGMGGKKLSKRDGAASMLQYRDKGYDPDALLNFMLRLGWGPTIDDKSTALLPRERAIQLFLGGGKMKSSPANMDLQKLESFDRKYKALKKGRTP